MNANITTNNISAKNSKVAYMTPWFW